MRGVGVQVVLKTPSQASFWDRPIQAQTDANTMDKGSGDRAEPELGLIFGGFWRLVGGW